MRKIDFIFISGIVVLLVGYYFMKSSEPSSSKKHSEEHPKTSFTKTPAQTKKRPSLLQGYTRLQKAKTVSNQQQPEVQKSPTEHYEETLRYYRLMNASVEKVIQTYKSKEQEVLQIIQSKKRDIENYENMMKDAQPTAEDLLFVVKTTQEMSIVPIDGALSITGLLVQFIKDTNKNFQEASLNYKLSKREWNHKDKMEFTRHIQNIVHRIEEADQYFNELTSHVNQVKQSMRKFTKLSTSSMNLVAELREKYRLKDKGELNKLKKEFKDKKQWEVDQIRTEAKGLEENISNKLKQADWLFEKLELHIKATVQTFEKAAMHFPVKRGLPNLIKKLENMLSQTRKT